VSHLLPFRVLLVFLTQQRALFGAAMVSNSPGTVVDIVNQKYLALAMSLWSIAPLNG